MTNETAKNASGYANGGGGVREAGHPGGAATAGIFVLRVPDAVTITNSPLEAPLLLTDLIISKELVLVLSRSLKLDTCLKSTIV